MNIIHTLRDETDISSYITFYNERAGIYEYDAGMTRIDAEWKAMNDALNQFAVDRHLSTRDQQVWAFCQDLITVTGFRT